mmetsp:Transcript_5037/g.6701  ORF Transcript_5037/g.6701 Transcript_5037/m.6701 type:complete len:159 (-) Transcript_5037:561-1037(-)
MVGELHNGEDLLCNLRNCKAEPSVILNHTNKLMRHQDFPGLSDDTVATVKDLETSCKRLLAKCTSCRENRGKQRETKARIERVVSEKDMLAEKFLRYPKGDPQRLFAMFELQSSLPKELVTKEIETMLRYEVNLASCNVCNMIEEETVNMNFLLKQLT